MALNRLVALLTPTVFAPLAGTINLWCAQHLPGISGYLDDQDLANAFVWVAGALAAYGMGRGWLNGWQKWEALLFGDRNLETKGDPVVGRSPIEQADGDFDESEVPPAFKATPFKRDDR